MTAATQVMGRLTRAALFACAAAWALHAQADTTPLVSEAEMRMYNSVIAPMASQSGEPVADAPNILWVRPNPVEAVQSPLSIQVLIVPGERAHIDWDSLRIFYGALRFDITDRILAKAKREDNQLIISSVSVPTGSHRLLIQVSDNQRRRAQRELTLHVTGGVR
jgi:hypothetical protein